MDIKVVVFDAMGVVFTEGDDGNNLLVPFIEEECDFHDPDEIRRRYFKAGLGEISSQEFWSGLGDYPNIERRYLESKLRIDPEAIEVLEYLKPRYNLALLSNDVSEWSKYLRTKFDLDRFFPVCVISGDVGVRKPSPKIYEILLEKIKVEPSECVFIDDRLRNLKTASELGMQTIYLREGEDDSDYKPDYSIEKLGQLKDIRLLAQEKED